MNIKNSEITSEHHLKKVLFRKGNGKKDYEGMLFKVNHIDILYILHNNSSLSDIFSIVGNTNFEHTGRVYKYGIQIAHTNNIRLINSVIEIW